MGQTVRCPNGHVLGEKVGDGLMVAREGRRVVVGRLLGQVCRHCRAVWLASSIPAEAALLHLLPSAAPESPPLTST